MRRRWGRCWGGLSCFRPRKGKRRVVPASRIQEGNASANRGNGAQPNGHVNEAATMSLSILAPPSSPASFTNSALPSTVQSPSCYLSLSANSPGGPSNAMYATGPYANETQLVSPPVFSTYTTEPSTAPLTPPPEMNHPTTPSSPDVPFAKFLSSMELKGATRSRYAHSGDLQTTYPLYPPSSASSLRSPILGDALSSSFLERESSSHWSASQDSQHPRSASSRLFGGLDSRTSKNFMLSQDSSFFHPATSAQFYLDQAQQTLPPFAGRLSVSRETDIYSNNRTINHHNRHSKNCKADADEIEAFRASFGFSADEVAITPQFFEILDPHDESFTITPTSIKMNTDKKQAPSMSIKMNTKKKQVYSDDENIFSRMGSLRTSRRYGSGLSISDAEVDYRRARSLREGKRNLVW